MSTRLLSDMSGPLYEAGIALIALWPSRGGDTERGAIARRGDVGGDEQLHFIGYSSAG